MGPEVLAKELGREQREVLEVVALASERGEGPHRKRERLVLLDHVQEPGAVQACHGVVGDVGGPPGRRDEPVLVADLERGLLAPEGDLQPVEEAGQATVRLDLSPPRAWERGSGVDGHQPDAEAAIGKPPRQVQLGYVTAEEVLEIDRRDQQVDALRCAVPDVELEGLDLLEQRPCALMAGDGGCGALGPERRHQRVSPEPRRWQGALAGDQRHRSPPGEAADDRGLAGRAFRSVRRASSPFATTARPWSRASGRRWRAVSPLGASMRSSAHRTVARAPSRTGGSGIHPRSTCCAMPQPWPWACLRAS